MSEPSKVIHVRNVGHEISENDLLQLFQPFGVITKLVMLRAKNQALVQMQDVASAINVLQFYANVQPSIRGRNVYVQFSSHQELTTIDQNSHGRGDEVRGGVDLPFSDHILPAALVPHLDIFQLMTIMAMCFTALRHPVSFGVVSRRLDYGKALQDPPLHWSRVIPSGCFEKAPVDVLSWVSQSISPQKSE